MIDLEQFKQSCNKKRCLRQTMITPQCHKNYKQEQCYNKYVQKQEKDKLKRQDNYQKQKNKPIEVDGQWIEVREKVRQRDGNKCRLLSILTTEEKVRLLKEQRENIWLNKTIDPAHVIARSQSPKLIYCERNIVMLGRLFHSRLDTMQNPLTGKPIIKEEVESWWIRIIGYEEYVWLITNK